jgi:23S rRNA pseudouridine1911/1915/1917 synthase
LKASYVVEPGQVIEIRIPPPASTELVPMDIPLEILFEDADVAVVNKPAGIVMHPAAGHQSDTLVNALIHHMDDLSMGFQEDRPGIVHRLDKETSGLVVIAKNDSAQGLLSEQFQERSIHRIYWAVTFGRFRQLTGRVESVLGRHPKDRKRFSTVTKGGKNAITHYDVKGSFQSELSLVRLKLETGRTHQIRVHMAEQGHSIVGDWVYGNKTLVKNLKSSEIRKQILGMKRFALHAAELGFRHPASGKELAFKVPWPQELEFLIRHCGWDTISL